MESKHLLALKTAVALIESQIRDQLQVSTVCELSVFSSWELQRLFRAYTGDTISNYIRGRRLTLAAADLKKSPKKRLIETAIEYQFGSQEAFTRAFKRQFKMTPGEFQMRGPSILPEAKPVLDASRLEHIAKHISKSPQFEIIHLPDLRGIEIEIDSTLGGEQTAYESVKSHWINFAKMLEQLQKPKSVINYGLISDVNSSLNDERLIYAAATAGWGEDLPQNTNRYSIEKQAYAIFEVRGNPRSCHVVADYIYGIWLPQSAWRRAKGFDIEIFSADYSSNYPEKSILRYAVPIIPSHEVTK
jgi:AraC family transcriptional regulator